MCVKYCANPHCKRKFISMQNRRRCCSETCRRTIACHRDQQNESKKRNGTITLSNGLEVLDNIVWRAVSHQNDCGPQRRDTKPTMDVATFRFIHKKHAAA